MTWKRHLRAVASPSQAMAQLSQHSQDQGGAGTSAKYSSHLPEVYAGHPNRIQRYFQYADMDRDSDICAALDTIADFCTQSEEQNETPFFVEYTGEPNETETSLIKEALNKWVRLNDFKAKLWYIFRNTIQNGDAFFLRDPETGEWLWLDHFQIEMVKMDEEAGKRPDEYFVRALDYAKREKFATKSVDPGAYRTPYGTNNIYASRAQVPANTQNASVFSLAGANRDPRTMKMMSGQQNDLVSINADHIIHLSLSVGMDLNWPFGQSILECIFKTFKQKEMLEDSIIIYRVQRAPERRVFYIDTGSMPPNRAKAHIEQIKNEIHQRRIPNRSGGGSSMMDAAYSPMAVLEDYFLAQGNEGKGSKVETLPGGELVGEIGDLLFFSKKLARGLRIPPSYLSLGDEQSNVSYNDGKLGQAMIQEFRFNKYCMRLQQLLSPSFDNEFKRHLRDQGIEIDPSLFNLQFLPPQNFTKYRQIELDVAQVGVYTQMQENRRLSERFKLKRYLNLSEEELLENEKMWAEENADKIKKKTGSTPAESAPGAGLDAVGLRPGGDDMGLGPMGDEGDLGDPGAMPDDGAAPDAGGGGAPPAGGGGPSIGINPAGGG